ncbi:interaptin-like [Thrips palmi]|uniref:Interaptin-like n=1 Tax=Thrips palmi TaxID=161013 RepID=A0A6P8ZSP6_THRPL|nr:interaptin-like [Thrips palmi]
MDPGVSLFSGEPEALNLNNSQNQREEEEEALEDQRRRDQELKNLLTDAFDDLMDEEDDDDQSTVSSLHHNGFAGHSNAGSTGSNHHSPLYFPYNNHVQSNSSASPIQFENGSYQSPANPQPHYETNGDNFDVNQVMSRLRTSAGSHTRASPNGYANPEEISNMKHMISNQHDSDHFGYLSSIPQADFTTNGNIYGTDQRSFNGQHINEDLYRQADINSQDQLMILFTSSKQEVSNLNQELARLRHERDTEVEQLKRKVLLLEAEKQGAFLSHKEAQNLLSEYQTQISHLQRDVEDLRLKNISLEKSKEEAERDLSIAKASAAELLQKVSILQRSSSGLTSEKNVESFLKTMQQKHETQIRELQTHVETLTEKFSQKDNECCMLERKLSDAQRMQDALITEKGKVVNELNRQLEEAQQKVRDYANSVDNQATVHLRIQVDQLTSDRKALEQKLSEASKKLEAAEKDLKQYEAVTRMGLLSNGDSSFETDSMTHLGISRRHSLGGRAEKSMDHSKDSRRSSKSQREKDDLTVQLRDELHRALQGQKSKREEIKRLQGELNNRDQKIKTMKEQEKVYFVEAEKFKKNLTAVLQRLKIQEEEAKALQSKSDEFNSLQNQVHKYKREKENVEKDLKETKVKLERIKSDYDKVRQQLAEMELQLDQAKIRQVDHSAAEFLHFHDESLARLRQESSRQLEAQVVDYRVRMEQAQKECEEIKTLYIEVCSAKRALLTELQEEQSQVRKLTSDLEDMKEAQQSLEDLHRQERELNRRIRDDLEKERVNSSKALLEKENLLEEKVKERIASLCKENETRVLQLQKEKDGATARAEQLQQQVTALQQDSLNIQKLQAECDDLRKQAIEAPQIQQAELERISRELKQSRERVLQLEKQLRSEFQSQMDAMIADKDSLEAQLKQKDNQLEEYLQALSRIKPSTREVSVNTDHVVGGSSSDNLQALRKQFDEKIAEVSAYFKANEEKKFIALDAKHKSALALAEEHIKEETVKYFAEEIAQMEEKHRGELGSFAKKLVEMESTFQKHLTSLKNALQLKAKEVEDLNLKLQNLSKGKVHVNGNADAESPEQLLKFVEQLKKQTEQDRTTMTEALTRWADEAKELQDRETRLQAQLEELKLKYKNARKAALHYKKVSEEKEKHMAKEWSRLQSSYSEVLNRVKERVTDIVNGQEQEVTERLKRIELYYEGQMKDLEKKLKNDVVV